MAFGNEYTSDYAYFIAGGKTLEAIKQYEYDKEHEKEILKGIAEELGGTSLVGSVHEITVYADKELSNPILKLEEQRENRNGKFWVYQVDRNTPEGAALFERIADIPTFDLTHRVFGRRLTGKETVLTNPDNLQESYGNSHYREKNEAATASFQKIGDTYVVSTPRVIRGVFNDESKEASLRDHYNQAAGYTYEWYTPPDSQPIPYSRVVELREQEKGDQLKPATVAKKVAAFTREN